jgi:hypothetical protein
MADQVTTALPAQHATEPRQWISLAYLIGLVVPFVLAITRVAVWAEDHGFSPIGVIPLALGVVIGFTVSVVGGYFGVRSRLPIVSVAVAAALVAVAAEHGFFYLDYRSEFAAKLQSDPKAQLAVAIEGSAFRPASFGEFMSAEAAAKWPLWIGDACTMIAVAGLAAFFVWPHTILGRPETS